MIQTNALLLRHQRPLEKYFKTKSLVEICINQPGEIWLETFKGWEKKTDKELDLRTLKNFASNLATSQGQKFSDTIPILATSLPDYGFRVFVIAGSMVVRGFAMSIRVAQARRFNIEDYMPSNSNPEGMKNEINNSKNKINIENAKGLKEAIIQGKTILVAGGTSSGKTTLLNSLIKYIPQETRIISIEDSQELIIDHKNKLQLLKSKTNTDIAKITYPNIINACMRMRPDRLLLGELDIENTLPFLRMINTGHTGTMATIHAESPKKAIAAIVMNAQLNGLQGSAQAIEKYAIQSIDIIIHIKRINRGQFLAKAEYIR